MPNSFGENSGMKLLRVAGCAFKEKP